MNRPSLTDLGGWPGVLGRLSAGQDLTADEAEAALAEILTGAATPVQIAGFVVALRQKGETVAELTGLVRAMRGAAEPLTVPDDAIDLVGAGGSALGREAALNVSTMACFVAAAAGAVVCKHGNRKASSTSGSFDLLEALGVNIDLPPAGVERCLDEAGVGFAFARTFHPAMRHAAPVRAELGIPTVFNILGPLSHPGRLRRQVVGVSDPAMGERMIGVLEATGSERAILVTGDGGLDEFSTTGPNVIHELRDGRIDTRTVDPLDLGLARADMAELHGGDAAANAQIAAQLFEGRPGPVRDIVCLNATAGLTVAGVVDDLAAGIEASADAIDNGGAANCLDSLVEVSNRG